MRKNYFGEINLCHKKISKTNKTKTFKILQSFGAKKLLNRKKLKISIIIFENVPHSKQEGCEFLLPD
jgi:hypothetical protein